VPVADEVARALGAPLDVFTVLKLGVPGDPEVAMGAIATDGTCVLDGMTIALAGVTPAEVEATRQRAAAELVRREQLFRGARPPVDVSGSVVIVVDDGMATGATMRAAVLALRQRDAREIIVAVPVGSTEACSALAAIADDCVCLATPLPFVGVGLWYGDFSQTDDAEVRDILEAASELLPEAAAGARAHLAQ